MHDKDTTSPTPPTRFISYEGLRELGICYHRTHLWTLVQRGQFPRPVALGPGRFARKAWRVADIEEWMATRPLVKLAKERGQ
jgi:predicted DNA-binding transcriptional regulator AlpA